MHDWRTKGKRNIVRVLKKQPCYGRLRPDERELLMLMKLEGLVA